MASNLLAIIPPLVIYFFGPEQAHRRHRVGRDPGVSARVARRSLAIAMLLLALDRVRVRRGPLARTLGCGANGGSPVVRVARGVARPIARPDRGRGVAVDGPSTGYTNPVMVNDAPDPSVIRGDDGAFYAYTTQAYHDVEFTTLPILRSTDLVTWELVGDAFAGDARPAWIMPGKGNGDVWAPHIARVGGKYLLYYSASSAEHPGLRDRRGGGGLADRTVP